MPNLASRRFERSHRLYCEWRHLTENRELTWCQLCCHWLPLWQTSVVINDDKDGIMTTFSFQWLNHLAKEIVDNRENFQEHYSDVIMSEMASQITGVSIICSTVCSGSDQRNIKLRVPGLCEWIAGGFPSQWASNAEMFLFDDVTVKSAKSCCHHCVCWWQSTVRFEFVLSIQQMKVTVILILWPLQWLLWVLPCFLI